jgi:hypothetical protein
VSSVRCSGELNPFASPNGKQQDVLGCISHGSLAPSRSVGRDLVRDLASIGWVMFVTVGARGACHRQVVEPVRVFVAWTRHCDRLPVPLVLWRVLPLGACWVFSRILTTGIKGRWCVCAWRDCMQPGRAARVGHRQSTGGRLHGVCESKAGGVAVRTAGHVGSETRRGKANKLRILGRVCTHKLASLS